MRRRIRPEAVFVSHQNRRIHDAVGEPRQRQRMVALAPLERQQPVGAGDILQVFNDDAAVIDSAAVGQHEARHFTERVLSAQRVVFVERIGGLELDAIGEPQHVNRHTDLTPERRRHR